MRLAQGQVRCGACLTVFDAKSHALQRVAQPKPETPAATATPNAPSTPSTPLAPAASAPSSSSSGIAPNYSATSATARVVQFSKETTPAVAPAARAQPSEAPAPTEQPKQFVPQQEPQRLTQQEPQRAKQQEPQQAKQQEPSFDPAMIPQIEIAAEPIVLHHAEPRDTSPAAVLFWTLCLLVAGAGLLGQYLWFERASLAHQPALTPIYQLACERLRCDLNPSQGLASLVPAQVIARPHQQFSDLISLAIRIRNESAFAQPYPAIEVTFSDLKGNLITRRTFEPQQYLGGEIIESPLLPAGLDIEVNLPLTTPGEQAVSYEIRLHQARI